MGKCATCLDLALRLESMFAGNEPPPIDRLAVTSRFGSEAEELKDEYGGRTWHDLSTSVINNYRSLLGWLSPEGIRFFLPRVLFLLLVDMEQCHFDDDFLAFVEHRTSPQSWFLESFEPFGLDALKLIAEAIRHVSMEMINNHHMDTDSPYASVACRFEECVRQLEQNKTIL